MTPPIDTSSFPTGEPYDAEDLALLAPLEEEARAYLMSFPSAVPIAETVLAYGVGPIVALYLVRFERPIARGELQGETEMWVVVGDLPSMCFETEAPRTPAEALRFYCVLAEDWAYNALAGGTRRDADATGELPAGGDYSAGLRDRLKLGRGACLRRQITAEFTK